METLNSNTSRRPGFFYGYVIVAVGFIIMGLTFGLNYSFGVFFKPLIAEFGWAKATTSAAYSMLTLVAGFLGIFAGRLADRFGSKVTAIAGGCFLGLGFLLLSQVQNIWQFYLFYGVIVAAGVGGVWPALLSTVPRWFVSRRGLMSGIVGSGTGFGIILISPLASQIIYQYDWRTAYIIIGAAALVLIVLVALLLRRDPSQMRLLPYSTHEKEEDKTFTVTPCISFGEAVCTWQFWTLCIIYLCFGFSLHTVMVHVVPHAIELGIPAISAASILAIIGGFNTMGRLVMGAITDRFPVKSSLFISLLLLLLTLICLIFIRDLWVFYLFAVFFGFTYGAVLIVQPLLSVRLFGLNSLGVILGAVAFTYTIGGALGPYLSGYIFDMTGGYNPAFMISAVLIAIAVLLTVALSQFDKCNESRLG